MSPSLRRVAFDQMTRCCRGKTVKPASTRSPEKDKGKNKEVEAEEEEEEEDEDEDEDMEEDEEMEDDDDEVSQVSAQTAFIRLIVLRRMRRHMMKSTPEPLPAGAPAGSR
jgi:TATA-binding protein-associated factor Taf7